MPTIQDFTDQAVKEYQTGSFDTKYHLSEIEPQVEETEDGLTFWLKPLQGSLFNKTADTVLNFCGWSFYQYCKRISPPKEGIGPNFVRMCPPGLGLRILRTWSLINKERECLFRLRTDATSGRKTIRAILTSMHQPLDAVPVSKTLSKFLGTRQIEYSLTPRRWVLTFWEDTPHPHFRVGFRVMGSEVGTLRHLRIDTMLELKAKDGTARVPVLRRGKSLCTIPYSGSGANAIPRISENVQQGLQLAEASKEAVGKRQEEKLKYPVDEYMDILDAHRLPGALKAEPFENPEQFKDIETKYDLACLMGKLANEATGSAQLRLETSAGLYLLSGRIKEKKNRNEMGS